MNRPSETKSQPHIPAISEPGRQATPSPGGITRTQAIILVSLALAVFCVLGLLVTLVVVNRDLLSGASPSDQVVGQSPPPSEPPPTLTPTVTPSPSATATPRLPTATPTLVVPPELLNRDKINEITGYVVNIRGLEPLQDVPPLFLTRAQLRQHLETEYTEARVSSALDRDHELYVTLDLLDPAADFRQIALDSAAQNIAGFYAPQEQILYLVAESVNMFASEEIVYAHEYTHALQDQHFGLTRFLSGDMNADQAIAARALIEGDATLVMGAYQYTEVTDSELQYMAYRASFVEREVIDAVSPSLGVLTFFPYLQGSYFVYSLWVDAGFRWDGVNAAYDDPPTSSEQVMHPEKYLVRDTPQVVTMPDLGPVLGDGWHEVDRNVLGEIGLLAWLLDHLDQATAAQGAAGWDGDMYTLWSDGQGAHVLVVKSVWDAPGEAAQFFEAFTEYLTRRALGVPKLTLNEPGRRIWEYEGRATFLARAGDQVFIVLAPDRTVLDQVREAFPEF
ncbi:MAG: hypothetical protein P8186_07530 [Anaerolineae bacterium]|jgi:hypothetical protein